MAGLSFSDDYREMLRLIREARQRAGLTQADVARAFGRTQGAVSKMESGEIRLDPIELQRLAALFGVRVEALLPRGKKLEEEG